MMNRSEFMSRVIGFEQSPITEKYYEQMTENIFLPEGFKSELATFTSAYTKPRSESSCSIDDEKICALESLFMYKPDGFVEIEIEPPADYRSLTSSYNPTRDEVSVVIGDVTELGQHMLATNGRLTMIHIRQQNSYSPLQVTRSVFDELLLCCGIFPRFKDSILYLGRRNLEVEVAPPRLQQRMLPSGSGSNGVGGFECAYGLRFMEPNNKKDGQRLWSLRQSAVYCRTDSESQKSTWLFVSLCEAAQKRINKYVQCCGEESALHPFDIHFMLVDIAVTQWRPYLVELMKDVDDHTMQVLLASPNRETPIDLSACGERQQLKQLEDDISDMILAIEATTDTIASLTKCLRNTTSLKESAACRQDCSTDAAILDAFNEKAGDVALIAQTARALRDKLQSTTQVVSSFLDLGNGYSLENLARQAREENQKMGELAAKSTRDAAAVKVLTIITLVYLPTTVVSNFFSTQFVNQRSNPDNTTTLVIAGNWWIFVAASVPLTVLTLYAWWIWVRTQVHGRPPALCRRATWSSFRNLGTTLFHRRRKISTEKEQSPC